MLQLAIQHEADLIVSASGFIAANPTASNSEFVQWASSVQALERYPELIGFDHSVIVTAASCRPSQHGRHRPGRPVGRQRNLPVVPPGNRPYYCLVAAQ